MPRVPPRVIIDLYTIELPCSPSLQKKVVSHNTLPFDVTTQIVVASASAQLPDTKIKASAGFLAVTMAFCAIRFWAEFI